MRTLCFGAMTMAGPLVSGGAASAQHRNQVNSRRPGPPIGSSNDQQKFWEFYDALFSDQSRLDIPSLKQRAQTLGLNTATFNTCLDSGSKAATIQKDRDEAQRIGVNSTPTVFINGRLLGGRSYAEIQEVIEDELQRAAQKK